MSNKKELLDIVQSLEEDYLDSVKKLNQAKKDLNDLAKIVDFPLSRKMMMAEQKIKELSLLWDCIEDCRKTIEMM